MIRIVALIGIMLAMVGCSSPAGVASADEDEAPDLASEYAKGFEARAWLADKNHVMFEAGKDATLELVNNLYTAGAEGVNVTDGAKLDENSPMVVASTMVFKLPKDPAKRKAVLDAYNKAFELEGQEKVTDTGQEYDEVVID